MDYILIASVAGNVVLATYCWSLYKRLASATWLANLLFDALDGIAKIAQEKSDEG